MTTIKGLDRIKELLEEELPKIEEKKQIAQDNGAEDEQLERIDGLIGELRAEIVEAALEEADREVEAGKDEADRIKRGKGKKGTPADGSPADPEPADTNGKDGGNGGKGGGGGGSGDGAGSGSDGDLPIGPQPSGSDPGEISVPSSQCIYVRSDRTVWGWNRFDQEWRPHDFDSSVRSITTVGGGVLVIAENTAALFDCSIAEWLTPLETTDQLLAGGTGGTARGISAGGSTSGSPDETPGGVPPGTPPDEGGTGDPSSSAHFGGTDPFPNVTDIPGFSTAGTNVPPLPDPDELVDGPEPPYSPPGFDEPEPDEPSSENPGEPDDEDV